MTTIPQPKGFNERLHRHLGRLEPIGETDRYDADGDKTVAEYEYDGNQSADGEKEIRLRFVR